MNREQGLPLREALTRAGNTKLRPVLITTFTTILGILPLIGSGGTGSEIQRPLGLVLVAGLIFSTGLTLVVLPTIYSLFEGKVKEKQSATRELENSRIQNETGGRLPPSPRLRRTSRRRLPDLVGSRDV